MCQLTAPESAYLDPEPEKKEEEEEEAKKKKLEEEKAKAAEAETQRKLVIKEKVAKQFEGVKKYFVNASVNHHIYASI